jgi:hypothetical protein
MEKYKLITFEGLGHTDRWYWHWELKSRWLYICSNHDDGYSSRKAAVVGAKRAAKKLGIIIKSNEKG